MEHESTIHDLECQASACDQHPRRLSQDRFVLLFGVEEAERVYDDGSVGTFGSKWQAPHVAANPKPANSQFLFELPRPSQQGDREVEADDIGSTFEERECVLAMTTSDVNDPRSRRQLEQSPKPRGLSPHPI
jgi:hypothetical protein